MRNKQWKKNKFIGVIIEKYGKGKCNNDTAIEETLIIDMIK